MLFKLYKQHFVLLLMNNRGTIFFRFWGEMCMISSISLATCFPKLQPPSFCVEEDCETSLMLHYRSTRKGFTLFVKGNKKHDGVNSGCAKWFTRATGNWFDPKP